MSTTPVRTSRAGITYRDEYRTCPNPACGKHFWPKTRTQTYCCKPCYDTMHRGRLSLARREALTDKRCAHCSTTFTPNVRYPHQRFCCRQCQQAGLRKERAQRAAVKSNPKPRKQPKPMPQMVPDRIRRKPKAASSVAVLPGEEHRHIRGTFTPAEFEAAYDAIRRELQAQGKPLYRQTAEMVREVSRRELER